MLKLKIISEAVRKYQSLSLACFRDANLFALYAMYIYRV